MAPRSPTSCSTCRCRSRWRTASAAPGGSNSRSSKAEEPALSQAVARAAKRQAARSSFAFGDAVFAAAAGASGAFVLVLLGAIIVTLFVGGLPAFRHFGAAFL